jgi:NAD(P)-dependent dehydrogenase (short-subunit alcohol dehydrogenase family)
MMFPIPDSIPRVALITGGAQRLGLAIGQALASLGFDIAIHCNTSVAAAHKAAEALPTRSAVLQADLAVEAQTSTLIARARDALGPVGVLVNNASTFERDEWDDSTRAGWDNHLEPNLRAPFVLMQAFAKALPAGREGAVINLLDQRVWSLTPHFVSYTVSKAALWTLTQTMALALAPRIRVNGIGPGPALPSPRQSQEQFDRQARSVPLGHGTSPEEVARAAVAILAMPAMTGQMIALDGGQHLQWASGQGAPAPEE